MQREAQPVETKRADLGGDVESAEDAAVLARSGRIDPLNPEITEESIQKMQLLARIRKEVLKVAVAQTSPEQWTLYASEDGTTKTVRPTGGAADGMLQFCGLTFADPKDPDRLYSTWTTIEDEVTVVWVATGVWRGQTLIMPITGRRTVKGFVKTLHDGEFAALANAKSRAAQMLFGLNGRPPEYLEELGVQWVAKIKGATFRSHKDATDPKRATIPFGPSKGTLVTEATDEDLRYHAEQAEKKVKLADEEPGSDPEHAKQVASAKKYLSSNKALLAAIRAEQEKRKAESAAPAAPKLSPEDQEKIDQIVISIREEAAALGKPAGWVDEHVKKISTVEQATRWCDDLRAKRVKAEQAKGGQS